MNLVRRHWENLTATGLRLRINMCYQELVDMYRRSEQFTTEDAYNFQQLNEELAAMRRRLAEIENPSEAERVARLYGDGLITTNQAREALNQEAGMKAHSPSDFGEGCITMDQTRAEGFANQTVTLRNAHTDETREAIIGLNPSTDETREAMNQLRDSAYDTGEAISELEKILKSSSPVHKEVQQRMKAMKEKQEQWTDEAYAAKFKRKRRYEKE
jgi:gas vesicle protein